MSRHPPLDRIFDAVRRAGTPGADDMARHLEACATCRLSAAWIQDVLSAAATGRLPEPSDEMLARAITIPATTPQAGLSEERVSPRWSIARLVPNAFARPELAGVRGGVTRRFLYEAEDAHLDLEIAVAPGNAERCRLTGQLLVEDGKPPADTLAVLWRGDRVAAHAVGDELGIFVIDEVAPGEYGLEVWSPANDQAIRVAPLVIDLEAE